MSRCCSLLQNACQTEPVVKTSPFVFDKFNISTVVPALGSNFGFLLPCIKNCNNSLIGCYTKLQWSCCAKGILIFPDADCKTFLIRVANIVDAFILSLNYIMQNEAQPRRTFCITGSAAHSRLAPLLPGTWMDASPCAKENSQQQQGSVSNDVSFLWENAPRHETKRFRDTVQCYSHLPNGTDILDSKWALARFLAMAACKDDNNDLNIPVLATHCFRGRLGFVKLAKKLFPEPTLASAETTRSTEPAEIFYDLDDSYNTQHQQSTGPCTHTTTAPNLWVVKDAMSNGAGGIWVVGPENASTFTCAQSSPLIANHRHVAQQYAWPLVLYQGRKCHVRVYGLLTSDGRAFVHDACFLHVANARFTAGAQLDDDHVHITNCCANSHDAQKFAGEIVASLQEGITITTTCRNSSSNGAVVSLAAYAPSIRANLAILARNAFSYVRGGQANGGFEYLGMDFILSRNRSNEPVAYMLEVNAPPSQDTATGLPHAEALHDVVLRDLISLWVLPKVVGSKERPGGWQCVYQQQGMEDKKLTPSNAAIVNKMRWAILERKIAKLETESESDSVTCNEDKQSSKVGLDLSREDVALSLRKHFRFFQSAGDAQIFFENAGGSQVPTYVIDAVAESLACRNSARIGANSKRLACETLHAILGASKNEHSIFLGSNATSLFHLLANAYVQSGLLLKSDEIIISTENHLANVKPWLDAADAVIATTHWWDDSTIASLEGLLSPHTRIVAVSHASNIVGQIRDIQAIRNAVHRLTNGRAHVIVDGVASTPHVYADMDRLGVDWYVISCHKLFGPHLGALCGHKQVVESLLEPEQLELGTISYEACAGIHMGLGRYFAELAGLSGTSEICKVHVEAAYRTIASVEAPLSRRLVESLSRSEKVFLVQGIGTTRIPVASFVHCEISNEMIVETCRKQGIIIRHGLFLSNTRFQEQFQLEQGVVRVSLCHYNTPTEIDKLMTVLERLPGWF
jgi:selenocysteine lyase/cysteine desulfurase